MSRRDGRVRALPPFRNSDRSTRPVAYLKFLYSHFVPNITMGERSSQSSSRSQTLMQVYRRAHSVLCVQGRARNLYGLPHDGGRAGKGSPIISYRYLNIHLTDLLLDIY